MLVVLLLCYGHFVKQTYTQRVSENEKNPTLKHMKNLKRFSRCPFPIIRYCKLDRSISLFCVVSHSQPLHATLLFFSSHSFRERHNHALWFHQISQSYKVLQKYTHTPTHVHIYCAFEIIGATFFYDDNDDDDRIAKEQKLFSLSFSIESTVVMHRIHLRKKFILK